MKVDKYVVETARSDELVLALQRDSKYRSISIIVVTAKDLTAEVRRQLAESVDQINE